MFDKIKSYLKSKNIIKKEDKIYDFEEKDNKKEKMSVKISFLDRIKFIKFKNKNENSELNIQKIKEVRPFSYSSCACWNWIY